MAIVTAQSKIQAECSAFGRVKESTFNPGQQVQSIKFVSTDPHATTEHWATFPVEQAKQFKMGDRVNLLPTSRKGRDTFDIEPLEVPNRPMGFQASPAPTAYSQPVSFQQPVQQQPVQVPGPDKQAISAWITGQAKLYAFCQSQAIAALPDGVSEAAIQGAASTLYISTCRRFHLER